MNCTHPRRIWEPLHRSRQLGEDGPARFAFGRIPICANCRRILGDVALFSLSTEAHVKKAVKAFSGTSWALMILDHPRPPFNFKMGKSGLVPDES